jgi:hypothetical protein
MDNIIDVLYEISEESLGDDYYYGELQCHNSVGNAAGFQELAPNVRVTPNVRRLRQISACGAKRCLGFRCQTNVH